ncbi:MAG: DotU family type IV/VI secretion system protein [Lacipirellulaceae bacterium]
MTPRFAQAVDPVFLYALALLDRIARDEPSSPEEEQLRLRKLIDEAEASLGNVVEWDLAKYAIVSWIDEMLVDSPWKGRDWWSNNVLEIALFNSRQCHELFFLKAHEASKLVGREALEVFYVCVILGFRGLYHDQASSSDVARALNLPPQLEEWTRQTALSIRLGQGRPPLSDPGREVTGAQPLRPRMAVVWPWLAASLLAATATVVSYHYLT